MNMQKLREAAQKVEEAKKAYAKARDEFADQHSPVRVGDIITLASFTYTGKRAIVESVRVAESWGGEYEWRIYVRVLKKNGEPGANRAEESRPVQEIKGGKI
jgi:hypothetical protein